MLTDFLHSLFTRVQSMDKRVQSILIFVLVVYLIIMTVLIFRENSRRRLWKNRQGYQGTEMLSDRIFALLYQSLKSLPLTRSYMEKLSYQFRLICPSDGKLIARTSMFSCLISLFLSFLVLFFVFLINPQLITLITATFGIAILNKEIVGRIANNYEITLNTELQHLIENEIHNYYVNYRVDDALYQSLEHLNSNMKVVAEQIYRLLLIEDKEAALTNYYENIPNKYLREFVSLCVGVAERGDQIVNGKYLFVKNLENLYEQLEIENEKLQKLRMEFTGVMMVVILPIFCLGIVKWFCISIKSNMEAFYYGKEGFLIDIALLAVTTVVYIVMHKSAEYRSFHYNRHRWLLMLDRIPLIRRAMDNYCDKYASNQERLKRRLKNNGYSIRARHFMLRSFILAGVIFMVGIGASVYLNRTGRDKLLFVESAYVPNITSAAEESQYVQMKAVIEKYTKNLITEKEEKPNITKEKLLEQFQQENYIFPPLVNEALAEEILHRVSKYKTMHFGFLDLLFSIMISNIAFYTPGYLLKYTSTVTKDAMEDEVNQFNALIGMLLYDKSITVKQILMELESYAVIFRQSIKNCINDYGAGDLVALEQLKEDEPYPSLCRIVDNLIRCDDMPICEAFHEVDMEREGYLAKRRLANEKSIKQRVTRVYLLAAVPLLLLFAYGVIPTLVSSMNEISQTLDMLGTVW